MNDLFNNRIIENGKTRVPVWFMRQAGRYHAHYQNIKKTSDFMSMCKNPELACEVTLGPIADFKFDAAILFSDLLFPLEYLGMDLVYNPGPTLGMNLLTHDDFSKLKIHNNPNEFFSFQGQACKLLRKELPKEVCLLGFVGSPFTLFSYAVEGSHSGSLVNTKTGLYDGRFEKFWELLKDALLEEMSIQASNGAQAVAIFDTSVGELTVKDFKIYVLPKLRQLTKLFKSRHPQCKIIYYLKHTHPDFLRAIEDQNIDVLGVDWKYNIKDTLIEFGKDYYIQGNFDPCWLHLKPNDLKNNLTEYCSDILNSKAPLNKWIFGLGHGVLQHTPEENVRYVVEYVHTHLRY